MKLDKPRGATDVSLYVFVPDSSSTVGAGLTGLTFESAGLVCWYNRPRAVAVQIPLVTMTEEGAHADGGFVAVANMPGHYRLDIPNAVCAVAADDVRIQLRGAANMAPVQVELALGQDANVTQWKGVAAGDSATVAEFVQTFLDSDLAVGADTGAPNKRTIRQALRFLRNKWAIAGGVLVVFKEDDVTESWSATLVQAASNPVIGMDPPNA